MRRYALLVAATLGAATPRLAFAQDDAATRAAARDLANEGSEAYRSGDYDRAFDRFDRAFRLVGVPSLGLWCARSLAHANRLLEASERYLDVLRVTLPEDAPEADVAALRDAKLERDALLPRIPYLTIRLSQADSGQTTVLLDGERVEPALLGVKHRVNPGTHVVRAVHGNETSEQSIRVGERETKEVVLEFHPTAAPASTTPGGSTAPHASPTADQGVSGSNSVKTVSVVAMGAGAVLVVGGAVATGIALGKQASLSDHCPGGRCEPPYHDDVDSFDTFKTLSTIGLVGGALVAGAGAVLYLTSSNSPAPPEAARVGFWLGAGSAGVDGVF